MALARCTHATISGKRCKNKAGRESDVCSTHGKDCPVCLGNLFDSKRVYLRCKHAFHEECVSEWIKRSPGSNGSCPICRAPIVDEVGDDANDPQYISTYRAPAAAALRFMGGHNRRESWMAASLRVAEILLTEQDSSHAMPDADNA